MNGSAYERELRDILEGRIEQHSKSLPKDKLKIYSLLRQKPFLVVRGAGSLGIDLIAMRGSVYLPIEVKTSKSKTIYFSDDERLTEQLEEYKRISNKCDLPILYARRMNGVRGEKWEFFRLDTDASRIRCWTIPDIPTTKQGSHKLTWGQGLPLSTVIYNFFNNDLAKPSKTQFTTEYDSTDKTRQNLYP